MSNYSYSEIQSMQRKALERVERMRQNTEKVLESAQEDFSEKKTERTYENSAIKPKVTNMPPNFPKGMSYPDFKEFFGNIEEREQVKPKKTENRQNQSKVGVLDNLFAEPDRAILMGLIMLLKSEGADEMLIMALMYILS